MEVEYLALSSNGDYATLPSEKDMLLCVFSKGYISLVSNR